MSARQYFDDGVSIGQISVRRTHLAHRFHTTLPRPQNLLAQVLDTQKGRSLLVQEAKILKALRLGELMSA